MAEIGPSSLGVVHSSCSLEGPLAWAIWWPAQLAPGGPPPHSSVSGHPRRRQLWPLGDGSNCITCAGHLLCCHVQPLHSCTSSSHSQGHVQSQTLPEGGGSTPELWIFLTVRPILQGTEALGPALMVWALGTLQGPGGARGKKVALFSVEVKKGR